jgi:magnesium chelatase subunit I
VPVTPPSDLPRTLGALRASGHELRGVKTEIRGNLLAALRAGRDPWPGIVGFESTVLPQLERALLAGHDLVLLGERGQGKTRLLRSIVGLLDEWTPAIEGSELGEHPYEPIAPATIRRAAELGDDLPVTWKHRSERYTEKLATPDTAVADLIGDVDPVKVAEGRSLGDPETIHFGLVPRAHRGVVAINELPDLAERIQVSLLNVMEERDIQVRGYTLRLPLDILLVASANPEDYTNRGRIITPLKDRFGAEVRTHYPLEVADEVALVRQEAELTAEVPRHLVEVVARFTRHLRESSAVDQGSGVSARFAVAAAETVAAAALRRAALTGEPRAFARPVDLETVPAVLRGKLEFEAGEEGREEEILEHLLRRAVADTARFALRGVDLSELADEVATRPVRTGERVPAAEVVAKLPQIEALTEVAKRLDAAGTEDPGPMASAAELALEYLFLTRKLAKDSADDGDTVEYG